MSYSYSNSNSNSNSISNSILWYSFLFKAFIISGIITLLFGYYTIEQTSVNAYRTSFIILDIGMAIIILHIFLHNKIKHALMYSMPLIITICTLSFMLYLIHTNTDILSTVNIPPSYNTFFYMYLICLLIQLFILYNVISTEEFQKYGKANMNSMSYIFYISIFNIIWFYFIYIILKYNITQGFTTFT
jgi:hypothetical protein